MTTSENKHNLYFTLLLKELDVIQDTIKNLDDIIYKTKNFAFLAWGGSLYLFTQHLKEVDSSYKTWLYALTAFIPLLFWVMDFRWRKHLLNCSEREKIISLFINSDAFEAWMAEGKALPKHHKFPLYDPVGWIYTEKAFGTNEPTKRQFGEQYLVDDKKYSWREIAFYKDAYIFYGTLMLLSVVFAFFYFISEPLMNH